MVANAVEEMYEEKEENKFLEVTYERGGTNTCRFRDFASGAMIENIVSRAKESALKRLINDGEKGITYADLEDAVREEYKENEDLPNTANPDDWVKIYGKRGEKILNIRPLMRDAENKETKTTKTVGTGQYL